MRPHVLAASSLVLFLFSPLAPARSSTQDGGQAAATETLPNAAALVRRSTRVTGEAEALQAAQARTLTGTLRQNGADESAEPGTVRLVQARPDRFLLESTVPGVGSVRVGHDGETVWWVHPETGPTVLDGIPAAQQRVLNAFEFPLRTRKHVRSMETLARTEFDGRDCYQVRSELMPFVADGKVLPLEATLRYRTLTEYYEVDSGLLAGTELVEALPQGDQRSTTVYRAYRELLPGVQVATELESRVSGQAFTFTIRTLSFDEVAPETFTPPAEVRALLPGATGEGGGGERAGDGDDAGGDDAGGDDEGGGGEGGGAPSEDARAAA